MGGSFPQDSCEVDVVQGGYAFLECLHSPSDSFSEPVVACKEFRCLDILMNMGTYLRFPELYIVNIQSASKWQKHGCFGIPCDTDTDAIGCDMQAGL